MKAQGLVQEVSQCLISAIFVMHVRCAIIIIEVCVVAIVVCTVSNILQACFTKCSI